MSPTEAMVSIVAVIGVLGAPVAALYLWIHRPAARKDLASGKTDSALEARLEARLERIEMAVQAIAVETERITEGQRFTTKLLTASRERSNSSTDTIRD